MDQQTRLPCRLGRPGWAGAGGSGSNKDLTKSQKPCNNLGRYFSYNELGGRPMIAIAAAGAFIGLFALWVVLPKKLMRK